MKEDVLRWFITVRLTYLIILSVYFDLITKRISPTLHLQLNNRRDQISMPRRRFEVANSRSSMHNWQKMWYCAAEVELGCPVHHLLETNKRQGYLKVDWRTDILRLMRSVNFWCSTIWNHKSMFLFLFRTDFKHQRCYSKPCAYHSVLWVFPQHFPKITKFWMHLSIHVHGQVRSFQRHAEPGNLRKSW